MTFREIVDAMAGVCPSGCEIELTVRNNRDGEVGSCLACYDWDSELLYFGIVTDRDMALDVRDMLTPSDEGRSRILGTT